MKKMPLMAILLISIVPPLAFGVDTSLNVEQIGSVNLGLADVWGWYDSQNNKYYGLACDGNNYAGGLILIETTDPAQPQVVGTLSHGITREALDVMVTGDYAFVASQHTSNNPGEIWIYHIPSAIANPNAPPEKVLTLNDWISSGDTIPILTSHELFVTDDFLFLAEGWMQDDPKREVAVLKISNGASPAQPELLAVWDQYDFDTGIYDWAHNFYVKGDTAFIFAWDSGVYRVVFNGDSGQIISWKKIWYDGFRGDVANITPYDSIDCGGSLRPRNQFAHSGWLSGNGQTIFVADEGIGTFVLDCDAAQAPCLRAFNVGDFWDVSDPSRDTVVSPINAFDILWRPAAGRDSTYVGATAIDQIAPLVTPCPVGDCAGDDPDEPNYLELGIHNPHVNGRLLFMSWYGRGLQILDISDISNMKRTGFYDLDGWKAGYWGVYPYSPDGYIYCSGAGFTIYRYGYTGTIAQNTTWRGDVYVYNTLTVPSGGTLTIQPGTNIYMFKDAVINVNGTFTANGTSADSVKFLALGGNPQPGDWQGIHFLPGSGGNLSYCSISNAVIGIEIDNNPTITLNHSLIKNCSMTGIDSYKGTLNVTNSRIDYNGIYGIYAYMSTSNIDHTTLIENGDYGIYIYYPKGSNDYSYVRFDTIDNPSGQANQYGIMIRNHNRVEIYKTKVHLYENGLGCFASNVLIQNCDFNDFGSVGVYSQDHSKPKIRKSFLGGNLIGLKTATMASADVGKGTDAGNTWFTNCTNYFIYHGFPGGIAPSDTIFAEQNWFGPGVPNPIKFYYNWPAYVDYNPYLALPPPPPRLEPEPELPLVLSVNQNYPNPFNPQTTIRFSLGEAAYTTVEIFNIMGQMVTTLLSAELGPGEHLVSWNGKDDAGVSVASGIYLYDVQAGEHFDSKKMIMMR